MPDFNYLPGVKTEVNDLGTRITQPEIGPKLVVIGTTDNPNAPLEEPFPLRTMESLSTYFDKAAGGPSEITRKVLESMGSGARNVEIFVLSDGSGNRFSETGLTPQQRFLLMARSYELLLNHDVDIVVACGVAIDMTGLAAGQNSAYQMANFCYQATKEYNSCIGSIGVQPPTAAVAGTGVPSLADQATHVNALVDFDTSGLQGADITIYDGITDVLPGPSGDGVPDNYAFWATTDELIPAGSPPAQAANIRFDGKGNPIDIGAYISVVSTWCRYRNDAGKRLYPERGYYNACGDGSYAGLITTLPPEIATTNQVIPGCEPLRSLSARQANSLSQARFVAFWTTPAGFAVVSGMTGAYNISDYFRSDFVRLSTVRITHDAVNTVRLVANPYIGKPNNAQNRSALEDAIDSGLGKLQKRGALQGFRFNLESPPNSQVLGQIIVNLTIIPAFEITEIRVKVGLSAS